MFGADSDSALDALELTELAWHDCYAEVTPPEEVVDDILAVSGATLPGLLRAARLAVQDPRDLRVVAQQTVARAVAQDATTGQGAQHAGGDGAGGGGGATAGAPR